MTINEIKKEAKVKLTGGYGKALAISFLYFLITFLLNSVTILLGNTIFVLIYQIFVTIISLPLSFGMLASIVKIVRNEDVSITEFVSIGFKNIKGVWRTYLRTIVKLLLPVILIIVAYVFLIYTIIQPVILEANTNTLNLFYLSLVFLVVSLVFLVYKSLSYSLTTLILCDKPESTGTEINDESEKLMKGNKGKIFLLMLSFIGWYLLISLIASIVHQFIDEFAFFITLSIGQLLLMPYLNASIIVFYEDLKDSNETIKNEEQTI